MKKKQKWFNFSFFYLGNMNMVFITAEAYKNSGVDVIKLLLGKNEGCTRWLG